MSWESISENDEKEAVKFIVYQFNIGENINLEDTSKIIALTGDTHFDISKNEMKQTSIFIIQAVNRNNNISKPVRIIN